MREPVTLERRIDANAARKRFGRLDVQRFEPAWVSLWGFALGASPHTPSAWLLATQALRRPLLLAANALSVQTETPSQEMTLDGGEAPAAEAVARQWFWERLANPRRWDTRLLASPPTPLWLPCWLGYSMGYSKGRHQHRVSVLSGLSGEALPMLKPLVLSGLQKQAKRAEVAR